MPNLVYQIAETALEWKASGGDELLTLTSLAPSAGRQGAQHDFGTAARARTFMWRVYMRFSTTPVVGETIGIFWKSSDGTYPDNDDGTGDIAVSSVNKLRNLEQIGLIIVDQGSSTPTYVASGEIDIGPRYGSPVFWNYTTDTFSSTAADSGFILTPIPLEGQ